MKPLLGMLICALPLVAARAGPVAEVFARTPPYFVVRYGLPDSVVESERWAFAEPGADQFAEVRGRFSIRRYHDRETRVEAVFFRPELVLAAVTIQRAAKWTQADVETLLAEYGSRWRQLGPVSWVSEEGVRAFHRDGAFHLLSPRIVAEMGDENRS